MAIHTHTHTYSLTSIKPVEWEISFAFPIFSLFHLLAAVVAIVVRLMVGLKMAHPKYSEAARSHVKYHDMRHFAFTQNLLRPAPVPTSKNYSRCYTWRCSHCCCCCCSLGGRSVSWGSWVSCDRMSVRRLVPTIVIITCNASIHLNISWVPFVLRCHVNIYTQDYYFLFILLLHIQIVVKHFVKPIWL